jgi:hypothetical protein
MPTPFVPVPSKGQILGAGCTLSILGITGIVPAATAVPIGELSDFRFASIKRATTTNTNFDSGQVVQKLGTTLDLGSLTGTYNRVSNNAGQLALIAANSNGAAYDFQLQLTPNPLAGQTTTGDLYKMSGIVTEAGAFDLSQTKVSSATFSIDLNSVVFTAGS